ncbi:MAG: hypothetical protein ACK4N5_25790, partial [Myxococcales bacterium]
MSRPRPSRARRKALVAAGALALALALSFVDWRPARPDGGARLLGAFDVREALVAGAARVSSVPELPTTVAGYPPLRPTATEAGPLDVRALIVGSGGRRAALVSVEALLVPDTLVARVRERAAALRLDALLLTATHTHSSFGGYDPHLLAEIAGTGRHDEEREAWLTGKVLEAL